MNRAAARFGSSLGILVILVVALSGCGFGPGEKQGRAALLVTSGYGREVLAERGGIEITESTTALKMLDQVADLETAYGGGFVQSVDGLSGAVRGGRSLDWFYSVNGIVAERGSADYHPRDGDTIWWDYRDWTDAMQVGAVVGVYPAPFTTGYDDQDWPTGVECQAGPETCYGLERRLRSDGATLVPASAGDSPVIRVLAGPWEKLRKLPEGRILDAGPARSGVFARFDGEDLIALDTAADPVVNLGPGAGLVAAIRQGEAPPVWILTGGNESGVARAVGILERADLKHRYAAVAVAGKVGSLPWPGDDGT